jgi:hypothetical protein
MKRTPTNPRLARHVLANYTHNISVVETLRPGGEAAWGCGIRRREWKEGKDAMNVGGARGKGGCEK